MPVVIQSPIDVVVRLIPPDESHSTKAKGSSAKGKGKGKGKKKAEPAFFTDEDLIKKATKPDKHKIPPKDLFNFIDALDAYEIDKGLEETLVVDITEITNDGLVVIHIEPKKMIRYADVYGHIEAMMKNAFETSGLKDYEYEIKKILFRIYKTGIPSSVVADLKDLKNKVDELWESEFGDEMKSYV